MNDELDTLLTALYVKIDDELETNRWMGTDGGSAAAGASIRHPDAATA
ncbi:hypothetical protein ACFRCW_45245 [Streptomyces sp. NPDC056653]